MCTRTRSSTWCATSTGGVGRRLAAPAQRPRHRGRGGRAWATSPVPTASRGASSATASGRGTSAWSLGMNLFSQGIDPQIDFSNIDEIRRTVEYCNQPAGRGAPPVGRDLVYTSFSGSHQDAIKKGFEWLDHDAVKAGKTIDEIVGRAVPAHRPARHRPHLRGGRPGEQPVRQRRRRVHHEVGAPPRPAAPAPDRVLRRGPARRRPGRRGLPGGVVGQVPARVPPLSAGRMGSVRPLVGALRLVAGGHQALGRPTDKGNNVVASGTGNGPIAAFTDALSRLGVDVRVLDYHEHALSAGGDAKAAAYVECAVGERVLWGSGSTRRSSRPRSRPSCRRSTGPMTRCSSRDAARPRRLWTGARRRRLGPEGLPPVEVAQAASPSFVVAPGDGRFVYAALEGNDGRVAASAVTDDLPWPALGQQLTGGAAPVTWRSAGTDGGQGRQLPVRFRERPSSAGRRTPRRQNVSVEHHGTPGPRADRQDGPHAHQVVFVDDGLLVCDLGLDEVIGTTSTTAY